MSPRAPRDRAREGAHHQHVSIPVVVDEPSGGADNWLYAAGLWVSQSLLSWMSPRAEVWSELPEVHREVSIPVVVDEPSGGTECTVKPAEMQKVSIPVVVDEPSGADELRTDTMSEQESQSLLSWMSPRARDEEPCAPPGVARVSIPVVVDEPSGARARRTPRRGRRSLNPCCRG